VPVALNLKRIEGADANCLTCAAALLNAATAAGGSCSAFHAYLSYHAMLSDAELERYARHIVLRHRRAGTAAPSRAS
jgi:hypothetical protein